MNFDQFFITRKRKKWKFAHFAEWPNCFETRDIKPEHWAEYFKNSKPLVIEVGAGTADLSVGLSKLHQEQNFVALDVKADRLYTGAKVALQRDQENLAFVRAHANQLMEVFESKSVQEIWVTFPDPFPRKRQAKHRLTHAHFLGIYSQLLSDDGVLRLKTDNRPLFLWSLEQLVAEGWDIKELSFNLHESNLPFDYKITTFYERKFLDEGIDINYVSCTKP